MMNEFLMCRSWNHHTVPATKFCVQRKHYLDSSHAEFWQHDINKYTYRFCDRCWDMSVWSKPYFADLELPVEDYLAALAMAEL